MQIEHIDPRALKPHPNNSRIHPAEQLASLAASFREFGFNGVVVIDEAGVILAGHGRTQAAIQAGIATIPCQRVTDWPDAKKRAYVIADNQIGLASSWDEEMLRFELADLVRADYSLDVLGFDAATLADMLKAPPPAADAPVTGLTGDDEAPEPDEVADPVSVTGDVWVLGSHRVMCGDSTLVEDVRRLTGGTKAHLLHADPPYGMGKAADGVANDNLYADKLDQFQLAWWRAFRAYLHDNASAYVWGNALDLWRLWFRAGLGATERFEWRNQIVWDKKSIAGMKSDQLTQFPTASEHCLFFQFGNQFLGAINADDFPDTWEPLRAYMQAQAELAGIRQADIKRVCGCSMYSHWFTRSQFTLVPEKHYAALAAAYPMAFQRPWAELKAEWEQVRGAARVVINGKLDGVRAYFDNAHDVMRDVWEFPRVTGEERHGHATPKPVAMMERVMLSSLPPDGVCLEPFGGSGSTLIGAEKTGRACYTMELQPMYVDVIVKRWQAYTGRQAVHADTGEAFNDRLASRAEQAATA